MENWYKAVLVAVLALATIIGILAGNMQSTPTSASVFATALPSTSVPAPSAGHIEILGTGFDPQSVTVRVGQKLTWTNLDTQSHGPVADNSAFSAQALGQGQSFSWTPTKPGTYTYADFNNSSFTGTVIVKP